MATVGANGRLQNRPFCQDEKRIECARSLMVLRIVMRNMEKQQRRIPRKKNMIISHCTTDALVHRFVAFAIRRRRVCDIYSILCVFSCAKSEVTSKNLILD